MSPGEAEAFAIHEKAKAEAEAMQKKAEALQEYEGAPRSGGSSMLVQTSPLALWCAHSTPLCHGAQMLLWWTWCSRLCQRWSPRCRPRWLAWTRSPWWLAATARLACRASQVCEQPRTCMHALTVAPFPLQPNSPPPLPLLLTPFSQAR